MMCTLDHIGMTAYVYIYTYIYIISRRSITPQRIKYNSKSLEVVQSLYFDSMLPYQERTNNTYVPDEGNLLPTYRDCTTPNDLESYIYIDIPL